MRITHLGHSCLLVEIDGARVLIDPGSSSHGFEELTDLDAVVITHQHADHVDVERLPRCSRPTTAALLLAEPETAAELQRAPASRPARCTPARRHASPACRCARVGGRHAVIHPDVPRVGNVAVLIGTSRADGGQGLLLHPGDAYDVVPADVDVLALPLCGAVGQGVRDGRLPAGGRAGRRGARARRPAAARRAGHLRQPVHRAGARAAPRSPTSPAPAPATSADPPPRGRPGPDVGAAVGAARVGVITPRPAAPIACTHGRGRQLKGRPVRRSYASTYRGAGALARPRRAAAAAAARRAGPSRTPATSASPGRTACRTTAARGPAAHVSAGQKREESGVSTSSPSTMRAVRRRGRTRAWCRRG